MLPKDSPEVAFLCNRVRNVLGPILRDAIPADLKQRLLQSNELEPEQTLFALYRKAAPGGPEERSSLLSQIQTPEIRMVNDKGETSYTFIVQGMRDWNTRISRVKKMPGVEVPDSSILWKALQSMTTKALDEDKDISHRVRQAQTEVGLPYRPTPQSVDAMYQLILSEFEIKADSEVVTKKKGKSKGDTKGNDDNDDQSQIKSMQGLDWKGGKYGGKKEGKGKGKDEKGGKGKDDSKGGEGGYGGGKGGGKDKGDKGKGKGKGKDDPLQQNWFAPPPWTNPQQPQWGSGSSGNVCQYFRGQDGCKKGKQCPHIHGHLEASEGRCFVCGSPQHTQVDCDRPREKLPPVPDGKGGWTGGWNQNQQKGVYGDYWKGSKGKPKGESWKGGKDSWWSSMKKTDSQDPGAGTGAGQGTQPQPASENSQAQPSSSIPGASSSTGAPKGMLEEMEKTYAMVKIAKEMGWFPPSMKAMRVKIGRTSENCVPGSNTTEWGAADSAANRADNRLRILR